jgi:RNA polymerase sigma-70 factor, ECF subfamily
MHSAVDREAAFRRLYEEHYGAIAACARRRLGRSEAEDLVAEVFLIAWRRVENLPGDPSLDVGSVRWPSAWAATSIRAV